MFAERYSNVFTGNETWNNIQAHGSELYDWKHDSTYIQEPPFFEGLTMEPQPSADIFGARVLATLGDSVTTDHISPAGSIPADSPAGKYLLENGVTVPNFNSYGSRRGNDRVLTRGTFANIRLKNLMLDGVEGGYTLHLPDGEQMSIYEAAQKYKAEGTPLVVFAGKEYGSGSSRDWAAKGPLLLGVKAVIAESFERIHRTNLVGMGVMPLQFKPGENLKSLGLSGQESFDVTGIAGMSQPGADIEVRAVDAAGKQTVLWVKSRLDTPLDVAVYKQGGILQTVLRELIQ
jgi:aconitate hydratase